MRYPILVFFIIISSISSYGQDDDGDGVPNAQDLCEGYNDSLNIDGDVFPDGCDDDMDGDGVLNTSDCNPTDSTVLGSTLYYTDGDRDGYGSGSGAQFCADPGEFYSLLDGDCNPSDDNIYPGAPEIPNDGIDQDCDGSDWVLDSDNDGTTDNLDNCPFDPNKTEIGICGCGTQDTDSDNDGVLDCNDNCPFDPNKTQPLICGCGNAENTCELVANFSKVENNICPGDGLFIFNNATGFSPDAVFTYSFPGGNPSEYTSTNSDPVYVTYYSGGYFDVSMKVTDLNETKIRYKSNFVHILNKPSTSSIQGDIDVSCDGSEIYNVNFTEGSSYEWNAIPGNITPTDSGNAVMIDFQGVSGRSYISVIETDSNECRGNHKILPVSICVTGVEDDLLDLIALFPNPFSNKIELKVPFEDEYQLTVTDIAGKTYINRASNGNFIFGNDLPKGLYIVQITHKNHQKHIRCIKQ